MRIKNNRKIISLLLCMMLIVAMALTTVGCGVKNQDGGNQTAAQTQGTVAQEQGTEVAELKVLGEGQTKFLFIVVDKDGNETNFEIHTDKKTVGEALQELGLLEGEEGEFGLYVKSVNGITADYDVDQTYWAFYVDGEYAMASADMTAIEEGKTYSFKVEK